MEDFIVSGLFFRKPDTKEASNLSNILAPRAGIVLQILVAVIDLLH